MWLAPVESRCLVFAPLAQDLDLVQPSLVDPAAPHPGKFLLGMIHPPKVKPICQLDQRGKFIKPARALVWIKRHLDPFPYNPGKAHLQRNQNTSRPRRPHTDQQQTGKPTCYGFILSLSTENVKTTIFLILSVAPPGAIMNIVLLFPGKAKSERRETCRTPKTVGQRFRRVPSFVQSAVSRQNRAHRHHRHHRDHHHGNHSHYHSHNQRKSENYPPRRLFFLSVLLSL